MSLDLRLVAYSVLLTWIMLLTSSSLRERAWSWRGLRVAFGNRDDMPEPSPLAARADRAAKNMLENLVLFVALVMVAHLSEADPHRVALGARLFFWSRVLYFPVYLAGIKFVRSAIWGVSVLGLGLILQAAL